MSCAVEFFVVVQSQHRLKHNSPLVLYECLLVVPSVCHAYIPLHTICVNYDEIHLSCWMYVISIKHYYTVHRQISLENLTM